MLVISASLLRVLWGRLDFVYLSPPRKGRASGRQPYSFRPSHGEKGREKCLGERGDIQRPSLLVVTAKMSCSAFTVPSTIFLILTSSLERAPLSVPGRQGRQRLHACVLCRYIHHPPGSDELVPAHQIPPPSHEIFNRNIMRARQVPCVC